MKRWYMVIAVLILLVACGESVETVKREGEPDIASIKSEDKAMNLAIQKAKASVDQFISILSSDEPEISGIAFKYPMTDDSTDRYEHLWFTNVSFKNDQFSGVCNNSPHYVSSIKLGDKITVKKEEISDWMYIKDGILVGGFTIRAIRDKYSGKDRDAFDRSLPFKIEAQE